MSFLSKLFNPKGEKMNELRQEARRLESSLGSKPSVAQLEELASSLTELVKLGDVEAHLVLAITYSNMIKAKLGWKEPEAFLIDRLSQEEKSSIFLDATGGLLMLDGLIKAGGKPKNETGQRQLEGLRKSLQQVADASRAS